MPRRLRLFPELGAKALEPRKSGGVSLIAATSKAGGPAAGAAGIVGCAWLGKLPTQASKTIKPATLARAAENLLEQRRDIFTDIGRHGKWEVGKNMVASNNSVELRAPAIAMYLDRRSDPAFVMAFTCT
jgi:hypothetical protein